jgi:HK97 family phage major capsid protein
MKLRLVYATLLFAVFVAVFTAAFSMLFGIPPVLSVTALTLLAFVQTPKGALFETVIPDIAGIIKKEIGDFSTPLTQSIEEIKKKQAEGEKAFDQLKLDLKAAADKEQNQDIKDNLEKTMAAVEMLGIKLKQAQNQRIESKGFGAQLFDALKAKEADLKNYAKNRQSINIELKAVGDIVAGNFTTSGTPGWVNPTDFGYVPRPFNVSHFRDFLGTAPVSTDTITIIRDAGGEGGPTTVAVGGLKPQSDRDWVKVVIPVTKVAHIYVIPEEYLNDISWLQSEISRIGTEELLAVEDAKIYSNATSGEFTGLVQNSTAFAAPSALALAVDNANKYDVLVAADTQARIAKENVTAHFVNPGDWAQMLLSKSTTGEYLFGPNQMVPTVLGKPLVPINQIATGKFISADKNQATEAIREGISVRFYDQDGNNARYNLVTVVIEERIALVVRRITGVIYGTFSTAAAALETA